ncbi:hypothetical protein AB0N09_39440 [Streptomyces erythrochromogenes]|uniref:hypothetical protein n=1 Tax=Streptomyces erythrochromogenes TaxID=285574 RepID=UPI00341E976C
MENGLADIDGVAELRELPELPHELWDQIAHCLPMDQQTALTEVDTAFHEWYLGGVRVRTQAGLDEALGAGDVRLIVVDGAGLTVSAAPASGAPIVARADVVALAGHVFVCDDVHVVASGLARVHAEGRARVTAHDRATVFAHDQVQVVADAWARIRAFDLAQVTASADAWVRAEGRSQVTLHDRAHANAFHQAQVTAHDQAGVNATEGAQVAATGSARVRARRHARVCADDHAWIAAVESATVTGAGDSVRVWAARTVTVDAVPSTVLRAGADCADSEWDHLDSLWHEGQESWFTGCEVM